MAVSGNALSTLTKLKLALGITASDQDTLLEQAIDRATQWIEEQTGRKLKARNYNGFGTAFDHKTTSTGDTVDSEDRLYFSGQDAYRNEQGYGVYHLPQFPILTVNSTARAKIYHPNAVMFTMEELASRGSAVSGNETWTTLTQYDDYVLDQENGILTLLGGLFVEGIRNYRVTCTAGLIGSAPNTQPYVPADLEQCCIEIAKDLFNGDESVLSETIGTWSRSYSDQAKNKRRFIQGVIASYKRFTVF